MIRFDLFFVCRVRKFIRERYTLDKREAALSRLAVGLFCSLRIGTGLDAGPELDNCAIERKWQPDGYHSDKGAIA